MSQSAGKFAHLFSELRRRRALNNMPPTLDRRATLKHATKHCTSGWSIYAQSGPTEGLEYCITKPIVIGRAVECDLTVLRSYISRNHAELKIDDGVLRVHDLGSSNGTLVNGVRINGSHALSHGDELRFKDVVFQVREDRSQFKSDAMLNQTMFINKPEIGDHDRLRACLIDIKPVIESPVARGARLGFAIFNGAIAPLGRGQR